MSDDQHSEPLTSHDDISVLRYLLHTVKGISPVSGGVLGEALEEEYKQSEEQARPEKDLDFTSQI